MASIAALTPEILKNYLWQQELMSRIQGSYSEAAAREILAFGSIVGSVIEHHPRLGRAMEYGRMLINESEMDNRSIASGTVILADCLTGSRGRFARKWYAPDGGLWGCLIFANTLLPESARLLPLALGVSCCEAILELGVKGVVIRWVNDILLDSCKVAGFLVETYLTPHHREEFNLLGFGININNNDFPEDLAEPPISLSRKLGRKVDIHNFARLFLAKLSWNVGLVFFEEKRMLAGDSLSGKEGAHGLLCRWKSLADTIGRRVEYGYDIQNDVQFRARVINMEKDGGLKMRLDDGSTIVEHSGELRYL